MTEQVFESIVCRLCTRPSMVISYKVSCLVFVWSLNEREREAMRTQRMPCAFGPNLWLVFFVLPRLLSTSLHNNHHIFLRASMFSSLTFTLIPHTAFPYILFSLYIICFNMMLQMAVLLAVNGPCVGIR